MTNSLLIPGLALILVGAWILWGDRGNPPKASAEKSPPPMGINKAKLDRGLAPLLIAVGILMTIAGALMWFFNT